MPPRGASALPVVSTLLVVSPQPTTSDNPRNVNVSHSWVAFIP
jgi:hypothetical protein